MPAQFSQCSTLTLAMLLLWNFGLSRYLCSLKHLIDMGSKKKRSNKARAAKKITRKPPARPARKVGFWLRNKWPALIILILPMLLYAATYQYGYLLDDKLVLSENAYVKNGVAGMADIFGADSFSGFLGGQQNLVVGARYRPLSIATFALEHEFYGPRPGISHFINVLLYALSGLAIFRIVSLLRTPARGRPWFLGLAFLTALFFVLHPIHTEVVANIKGRDEILALLLSVGALYYGYRYAERNRIGALLFSAFCFLAAVLAKENAVTFLAVVPLTLYLFLKASVRRIAVVSSVLLGVFVLYLFIRLNVIGYLLNTGLEVTGIMNNPFLGVSPAEKYATILYTLGKYVQLLIFPHPLTHDYYPYHIPIVNWLDWRALASLVLYLAMTVVAFRSLKKEPVVAWSIFFYLLTLSIVSNIVFPVGSFMNERFIYLPSLGYCWLLSYLIVAKFPSWLKLAPARGRMFSLGLIGLIALGYAFKTVTRTADWKDARSLNLSAVKTSANSARANSYMAYSLYEESLETTDLRQQKALLDQALPYVNRALEIYPEYTDAITCKGGIVASYYQMDYNLDKLLDEFYKLLSAGHVIFIDQYMEYLNSRADRQKLADFYYRAGYELFCLEQKNYALAVKYLNYGLQVAPNSVRLLEGLSETYYLAGNRAQSAEFARRALQIDPDSKKARDLLAGSNR